MGHPPLVAVCRRGIGSGRGKAACFRESTSMPVFLHTTPSKEEAVAELGVQLCDDWHRILLLRLGCVSRVSLWCLREREGGRS